MDKIHERIKAVFTKSGLTQSEFASRLNITQSSVSRLISGGQMPSDRTIADICTKFGVSEVWLRDGIGEMNMARPSYDELSAFFGDTLSESPGFRQAFLTALSRMTDEEWKLLERKVWEIVNEMQKTDPE